MSDCCSPGSGFPTASSMQQLATNLPVVWEEICAIQQAVLAASSQCQPGGGQMFATVGGNTPMTFITGIKSVTVTNGGAGYVQDTPSVEFIPPLNSAGIGATGTVTTNGGSILAVDITTGGVGYQPISATLDVSTLAGIGAVLEPLVDATGKIISVSIVDGGSGYTTTDSIIANRAVAASPVYTDALIKITTVSVTGEIVGVVVVDGGSGYQDSVTTARIISTLNPLLPYPTGDGFSANVITDSSGAVIQVIINNTGVGYVNFLPYLAITDTGSGAVTEVSLNAGSISSIAVTNPGSNYTSSATGTVMNPITAALPNPPSTPASVIVNAGVNTYGTTPSLYYQVWAGLTTNKAIQIQLDSVLSYFKGLGYTIIIQSNPATTNTIQWRLSW